MKGVEDFCCVPVSRDLKLLGPIHCCLPEDLDNVYVSVPICTGSD